MPPFLTHRTQFGGTVSFRVDVALAPLSPGTALWDQALWDQDLWSSSDPYWEPLINDVLEIDLSRGRERWGDEMAPPTASILVDNTTGEYSPKGGAPLTQQAVRLRPGRWVRISGRVTSLGNTWEPMFTGRVESIDDQYAAGGYDLTTRLTCVGLSAATAMHRPPPLSTPRPEGETMTERLVYLMQEANVWRYDVPAMTLALVASELPGDRYSELQRLATTHGGAIVEDRSGVVWFKPRQWLFTDPRSVTAQFTAGASSPDVQVIGVAAEWSLGAVLNDVRIVRSDNQNEFRYEDTASQALYGRRTHVRSVDATSSTWYNILGGQILRAAAQDRMQVVAADVVALTDAGALDLITSEVGDLVILEVNTGGPDGWQWWQPTHIQRVTHHVTADDWSTTYRLDDSGAAGAELPTFPTPTLTGTWIVRRQNIDEAPQSGIVALDGTPDDRVRFSTIDQAGTDRGPELVAAASSSPFLILTPTFEGPGAGWASYQITGINSQDLTGPQPFVEYAVTWLQSQPSNIGPGMLVTADWATTAPT